MKILIWTSTFYPVLGGVQTVTKQLAEGFSSLGHDVLVIANRFPRTLPRSEKIGNIRVIRFVHWGYQQQDGFNLKSFLFNILSRPFFPYQLIKLLAIIRTFKPEVINIHFPYHQNKYALRVKKRFPKIPMIVSLHGNEILKWYEKKEGFISDKIKAKTKKSSQFENLGDLLQFADGVTTCSDWLANKAFFIFSGIKGKTTTIWNAVDLKAFDKISPKQNSIPYFFSFGRLENQKGFDILITAYHQFSIDQKQIPKLIIAGSGSDETTLKQLANKLGIGEEVIFTGRLSQGEVIAYCKGAFANIIPSRIEPFGISVLEVLASYRPFVGFNIGGITEICSGEVELIAANSMELEKALRGVFLENRFQLKSEKIRPLLAKFSVEKMVASYLNAFQSAN